MSKIVLSVAKHVITIFGSAATDLHQDEDERKLVFKLLLHDGEDITLEKLKSLSSLLGTENVRICGIRLLEEGCSDCGRPSSFRLSVSCSNVVFHPCAFDVCGRQCNQQSTNVTKKFCGYHASLRCVCGRQAVKVTGHTDFRSLEDEVRFACSTCF